MASDQIELVTGLSPADAEAVMALGTRITLTPGAILFKLGENAQQVYLIKRGRLSLTLPMQVLGREEDMAGVAVYLSSQAGAYVTGSVLTVDGGLATTS